MHPSTAPSISGTRRVRSIRGSLDFRRALPSIAWWLDHPVLTLTLLGAVAAWFATLSRHYAIGVAAFGCFYWCLRVERRHLEHLAFPPLVLFGFHHLLASGLGLPLICLGVSLHGFSREGEMDAIWLSQVAHAIAFPILTIGYKAGRIGSPPFSLGATTQIRERTQRILACLGWLLFIQYLIWRCAGIATGSSDRSRMQETMEQGFGIWSWFQLFPRLNAIFFLLVPLMYRKARGPGRIALVMAMGSILTLNLFSGSRSQVLGPVCFLLIGWWMVYPHVRWVIRLGPLAVLLVVPFILFTPFYRSTQAFADARELDISSRLAAIKEVSAVVNDSELGGIIQLSGEGLNGVSDREVFLKTPEEFPHVGWENVARLQAFWLPSILARTKASLLDGNDIVQGYKPDVVIFGATISFPADLFRRFGWKGVVWGPLVLGLVLGLLYRQAFRLQQGSWSIAGTLFILYGLTFFSSVPYTTLLETCWYWLWEMPKHMLALGGLTLVASSLCRQFDSKRNGVALAAKPVPLLTAAAPPSLS